jgi:hypothetical protein
MQGMAREKVVKMLNEHNCELLPEEVVTELECKFT